ncbi:hypothetical protein [Desulfoluna spongiiphila]|uniref:DUF4239 domain-containing protein n=1 Tax=Desulfoluna spongiiphila TaxID=419481 RepID=A0A1G5H0W2_9BACT|nr:hypothetical protein [Desulfoluna spongiiphila]SCY57189.1 hypothetical protein SAMN05216233_11229 [Desulfoluna spongiiphila]VVS94693.1 hypothetical protein DBB_42650 [Desulfoluna spongiiphila]
MNSGLFESLPITWFYLGTAMLMLGFYEVGCQIGLRAKARQDKDAETSLGPMVGGLLGMLAFVLAFTFSMALSQHDLRKKNVLEEANAVGTAYLRSDLIDTQHGAEVKRLLKEYVDIRLKAAMNRADIHVALEKSVEIHDLIWIQVSAAASENPTTNTALMIQATNDVIDMHEKRVTVAIHNRIPHSVWVALAAITALTMLTMGTQVGLTGKRRFVAVIPLPLAFAVLMTLVVDLNRPQSGLITVGQQSMINLQNTMGHE